VAMVFMSVFRAMIMSFGDDGFESMSAEGGRSTSAQKSGLSAVGTSESFLL
jgi:hypothetical protein